MSKETSSASHSVTVMWLCQSEECSMGEEDVLLLLPTAALIDNR